jgi:hypothetical protein
MSSPENSVPVHRLLGVSTSRLHGSVVERMLAMRGDICSFNAKRGLRTAVWYGSGTFLQWHEGPAAAVEEAWQLSLCHPCNAEHRVIHRSLGAAGLVDRLHLCTAHNRDTPQAVAKRIARIEREQQLGWAPEPSQLWQQLSAPCLFDEPGSMSSVARFNVVAVTSELTESVDLVREIAEKRRTQVTYQRFADCDVRSGDIGAAYVDVNDGGPITRVQALSRRALSNGMVRTSLERMQCLVLLLGDPPGPAARLVAVVAKLLAGMKVLPSVRLIALSSEACSAARLGLAAFPGLDIATVPAADAAHRRVDVILNMLARTQQPRDGASLAQVA